MKHYPTRQEHMIRFRYVKKIVSNLQSGWHHGLDSNFIDKGLCSDDANSNHNTIKLTKTACWSMQISRHHASLCFVPITTYLPLPNINLFHLLFGLDFLSTKRDTWHSNRWPAFFYALLFLHINTSSPNPFTYHFLFPLKSISQTFSIKMALAIAHSKRKGNGLTRKCASLVKKQRARIYIVSRCASMLLCWYIHGDD